MNDLIQQVWEKGIVDDAYNPNQVRKDACGAWIVREHYGNKNSAFGWEIDHIYPKSKLERLSVPLDEIDNLLNLRPLNWRNNEAKADNFPIYKTAVIADYDKNSLNEEEREVNETVQKEIYSLYSNYLSK